MKPTEEQRRLRAIAAIAVDVLGRGPSAKDERTEPEIRDIYRLAVGQKPLTDVGKRAWKESER